jgi:hypothetical protein
MRLKETDLSVPGRVICTRECNRGSRCVFRGVGGELVDVLLGWDKGELFKKAISDKGAFGKRIPPSRGGDCK